MPAITFDEWKTATNAIPFYRQSQALKSLTSAFEKYARSQTAWNLDNLASFFQNWRTHGPTTERTGLTTAAAGLQDTITNAKNTNRVINVRATNVGQIDCYEFIAPVPTEIITAMGGLVPRSERVLPLKPSEISKVNEAFRRAKAAARLARDYMVELSKRTAVSLPAKGVPTALLPAQQREKLYVDYFGAFDQTRAKTVLQGYKDIYDSFDTM